MNKKVLKIIATTVFILESLGIGLILIWGISLFYSLLVMAILPDSGLKESLSGLFMISGLMFLGIHPFYFILMPISGLITIMLIRSLSVKQVRYALWVYIFAVSFEIIFLASWATN